MYDYALAIWLIISYQRNITATMKKVEEPQLIKLKLLYIAAATIAFAHKSVRKYRWLQSETARGPRYTHTLPRRKCYHDHAGNSCVRLKNKNEIVIKLKNILLHYNSWRYLKWVPVHGLSPYFLWFLLLQLFLRERREELWLMVRLLIFIIYC